MRTFRAPISPRNRGFTLLELIIVVLLISILITFASVNWNVGVKKGREALLESFSIAVSMIREEAISNYENRVVEFDIGAGTARVGHMEEKAGFVPTGDIRLPTDFRIKDVVVNGQPYPAGKAYMTFYQDGMVDRAVVHLHGEKDTDLFTLLVNPLTAKVTGENGYTVEKPLGERHNPS